ncbi:hypothetical protein P3S68_001943 [Capsicum galapagoense]
MPSALRNLFATILVHCNPADVRKLWDIYYDDMSEDFKRIHDNSSTTQLQCTLNNINHFLQSMGMKIENYDIPKLEQRLDDGIMSECREIREEESIIVSLEELDAQTKLNPKQEKAFKIILERLDSEKLRLFFIDGPDETGKTFLYGTILANIRSRGMIALEQQQQVV